MLSSDEVIRRLRESNVAEVSRRTGVPYGSLRKLVTGETTDPRASTIDPIRDYFAREDGRAAA